MAVVGRRGSKGYIGPLAGAYILWRYINRGNPQSSTEVDRDKRLSALVFGGKKDQAKANQWRDIVNIILGSRCFSKLISTSLSESLTVWARSDRLVESFLDERGIRTDMDIATFEILPKESTLMAGRGPATFMQFYDEMAHVVNTGAIEKRAKLYEARLRHLTSSALMLSSTSRLHHGRS